MASNTPNSVRPVCRNWLKGSCKRGDQCLYTHSGVPSVFPNLTTSTTSSPCSSSTPAEKKKAKRQNWINQKMMKTAGSSLKDLQLSTIQKSNNVIEIKDVEFLASYNWSNQDEPVIFVPGCPARLTIPKLPYQVAKDNGQVFIDQNSHRVPAASFDPFFKALLTMHPSFDMKLISLVTDRNSLRKLLLFVSGKVAKSWRIDVDIIEDTMFLTRWEENHVQIITGARDSGFGHEFEKTLLNFDANLKESSGHHRIVRYNLGGIDSLVRFEADGYIGDTLVNQIPTADELGEALSGLHMQYSKTAAASITEVKVVERGRLVDNTAILELKSVSGGAGRSKMQYYLPQLWFSQTHNLVIARHKDGLVEVEPEKLSMGERLEDWESQNQENLSALVRLLTEIKQVAKTAKGGKSMLVCKKEERQVLRVYERNGKGFFLPKGVRVKCWGA